MQPKPSCLNPYYTGIHLHRIYFRLDKISKCLNPYYTGIHLHFKDEEHYTSYYVLILIILEYIYII